MEETHTVGFLISRIRLLRVSIESSFQRSEERYGGDPYR